MKAFGIVVATNVVGFTATSLLKSEVVTDLMGVGSIGVSAAALAYSASSSRAVFSSSLIASWSLRLASFLAYRAYLYGDARFKSYFPPDNGSWRDHPDRLVQLATFWALQAVWGCVMLTPVVLHSGAAISLLRGWPGLVVAASGLVIEGVADWQKFRFKQNKGGETLMTEGLYRYVQYPNYTGEIVFWSGLGIYWLGNLARFQPLALLPAAFATFLLTKVSGIPLSEKSRSRRFADDPVYREYNRSTAWLVPGLY